jgi:hypothetical protein
MFSICLPQPCHRRMRGHFCQLSLLEWPSSFCKMLALHCIDLWASEVAICSKRSYEACLLIFFMEVDLVIVEEIIQERHHFTPSGRIDNNDFPSQELTILSILVRGNHP